MITNSTVNVNKSHKINGSHLSNAVKALARLVEFLNLVEISGNSCGFWSMRKSMEILQVYL